MFKLIILLCFLKCIVGQNDCPCRESGNAAEWIGKTRRGACLGQCKAGTRTVTRGCRTSPLSDPIICEYNEVCTNYDTCAKWLSWDNEGPCIPTCSGGMQKQKRYCYIIRSGAYIRSSSCPGSNGLSEQVRNKSCSAKLVCTTNSPERNGESTTVKLTPSKTATTSPPSTTTFSTTTSTTNPPTTTTTTTNPPTTTTTTTNPPTTTSTTTTTTTAAPTTMSTTTTAAPTTTSTTTISTTPSPSSKVVTKPQAVTSDKTSISTTNEPNLFTTTEKRTKNTDKDSKKSTVFLLVNDPLSDDINKNAKTQFPDTTTTIKQFTFDKESKLTVPLVLCSVALICVAVIISFVIIFKRGPQDRIRNGPTEHDSKDNNNKAKTETPQYEDVGPALPPMRKSASKPVLPGSKIPLTVKNILYTTADELNSETASSGYHLNDLQSTKDSETTESPVKAWEDKKQTEKRIIMADDKELQKKPTVKDENKALANTYTPGEKTTKPKTSKVEPTQQEEFCSDYVRLTDLQTNKNFTSFPNSHIVQANERKNSYANDVSPASMQKLRAATTDSSVHKGDIRKDSSDIGYISLEQLRSKTILV